LNGKKPALDAWTAKGDTNDSEIRLWGRLYPYSTNTGILTRLAPAIDIDILNPEAAEAIEELARDRFEESGYFLVRTGQAPKRAILLRTLEPFKKVQALLIAPTATPSRRSKF
jgi:Bifunctional DNA primase/polymerase, N-terminal